MQTRTLRKRIISKDVIVKGTLFYNLDLGQRLPLATWVVCGHSVHAFDFYTSLLSKSPLPSQAKCDGLDGVTKARHPLKG